MSENFYLGIDLGGTSIKMGLVTNTGKLVLEKERPTPKGDYREVLHAFDDMMVSMLDQLSIMRNAIHGVGIGVPALLDVEKGFIHEVVNLGWKDVPLKEELEAKLGIPCFVDNDANTAALGEMWQGSGQGAQHIICVTVGTGIGGGLIVDGDIYHGANGMAGEIGHITVVDHNGRMCNCGRLGCLETESSATAIVHYGKQAILNGQLEHSDPENLSAKDVIDAAKSGNPQCIHILSQVTYYLGKTLAQTAILLNPEKIVIGGGVSKAGEFFIQPVRDYFNQFALKKISESVKVVAAELGNQAGMIGAAWLVHKHFHKNGGGNS